MMLYRHLCTPNINLATQTLHLPVKNQWLLLILQRLTSLSPQKHQQRFLDNVQSVLQDEDFPLPSWYDTGTLFN